MRNYKGAKHSEFAPEEGNRYDGLYKVGYIQLKAIEVMKFEKSKSYAWFTLYIFER